MHRSMLCGISGNVEVDKHDYMYSSLESLSALLAANARDAAKTML